MHRGFVREIGHDGRINVHQTHARMVRHDMTAADFAELARGAFGPIERGEVFFALGDADAVRRIQTEGVDRRGGPYRAVVAVTISHHRRRAADFDFHRATETASLVCVTHRDLPADRR